MPPRSNHPPTVVVGMSGGVDSSVAAALLKKEGYRVVGLFMKNWEEKDENGQCHAARDYEDVARVCDRLDIPYYAVEFVQEYWDQVFTRFLEEYKAGYTPNPDILCNREIKFNAFMAKAQELGGDYLATGHYCRTDVANEHHRLLKGTDPAKDQSYFLYTVNRDTLSKVLFPIGQIEKSEVRRIARELELPIHDKKDSTGICFIGERNFRPFLSRYLAAKPGPIRTLEGETMGEHPGSAYFTIGQRKGLGLGGEGEPWFVAGKDSNKNIVYVVRGQDHPALFSRGLSAEELSWVDLSAPSALPYRCKAKIRYRQADQDCTIVSIENGRAQVEFDTPQRAVAPGQSIVFYDGEVCLGGGVIREAIQ